MATYLKKSFLALSIGFSIAACNSSTEIKAVELKKDSVTETSVPEPPKEIPVSLKNIVLNEKRVIQGKILTASQKADKELYQVLSIKAIDSTAADGTAFKYHIVDTLFSKPGLKILLIGREYDSENYIWLAIYNDQNTLIEHKTVYYDNAEGFLSVESVIKNNEIAITTYNEFEEGGKKTTEKFQVDGNDKLIKK